MARWLLHDAREILATLSTGSRKRPSPKRQARPPEPKQNAKPEGDDAPEIQVGFTTAGRDTLAAITSDVLLGPEPEYDSAPVLEFELVPAGRDTLAAITEDALGVSTDDAATPAGNAAPEAPTGVRRRVKTIGYEEMPVEPRTVRTTVPGVAPAPRGVPRPKAPAPAGEKLGRDTLNAIANAVLEAGAPPSSARARGLAIEAFELVTFVVRGDDLVQLSSDTARREFVASRLLHRLPVSTMDLVDRVDVTPWTAKGTLILRVWCKVRPPVR